MGKGGKRCSVAWSGEELVMVETTLTDRKISYLSKVCWLPLSFSASMIQSLQDPRMANLAASAEIDAVERYPGHEPFTYHFKGGWSHEDVAGAMIMVSALFLFFLFALSTHNVSRRYFA